MPVFKPSGSTGQAPTTSFFAGIADRNYTLLMPYHYPGTGDNPQWDAMLAALNVNQWTIFNRSYEPGGGGPNQATVTLGALTTAPDGNNTAQKVVETTSTSIHGLTAGAHISFRNIFNQAYPLRLSVFAKAAERTRIVLRVGIPSGQNGTQTVFDLAGGQIGVAGTAFGSSTWAPLADEISPYGNGWYRCTIDFMAGCFPDPDYIICSVLLDSGSGTAARSSSYAGNASDGVYCWRANLLPPGAWALNNQVFFDDFTTISTVDVHNTLAPGFNWYGSMFWPANGFQMGQISGPLDPSEVTQSGSVLTYGPRISAIGNEGLSTAGWTGGTSFVGQLFQPPWLYESSIALGAPNSTGPQSAAFWTQSIEYLLSSPAPAIPVKASEIDVWENLNGWQTGNFATFIGYDPSSAYTNSFYQGANNDPSMNGYSWWRSDVVYGGFAGTVFYQPDGNYYTNINGSNLNKIPPTHPADWGLFTPIALQPPLNATDNFDLTAQNVSACLFLPWFKTANGTGVGFYIKFFRGLYVNFTVNPFDPIKQFNYVSAGGGSGGFNLQYIGQQQHFPVFLGTSHNFSIAMDWVRVVQ